MHIESGLVQASTQPASLGTPSGIRSQASSRNGHRADSQVAEGTRCSDFTDDYEIGDVRTLALMAAFSMVV